MKPPALHHLPCSSSCREEVFSETCYLSDPEDSSASLSISAVGEPFKPLGVAHPRP